MAESTIVVCGLSSALVTIYRNLRERDPAIHLASTFKDAIAISDGALRRVVITEEQLLDAATSIELRLRTAADQNLRVLVTIKETNFAGLCDLLRKGCAGFIPHGASPQTIWKAIECVL